MTQVDSKWLSRQKKKRAKTSTQKKWWALAGSDPRHSENFSTVSPSRFEPFISLVIRIRKWKRRRSFMWSLRRGFCETTWRVRNVANSHSSLGTSFRCQHTGHDTRAHRNRVDPAAALTTKRRQDGWTSTATADWRSHIQQMRER